MQLLLPPHAVGETYYDVGLGPTGSIARSAVLRAIRVLEGFAGMTKRSPGFAGRGFGGAVALIEAHPGEKGKEAVVLKKSR